MSNNKVTHEFDTLELQAWALGWLSAFHAAQVSVKADPEFQEWAERAVTEPVETPNGWIPGWSMDDCARKWVDHHGIKYSEPPFPRPSWADTLDVSAPTPNEVTLIYTGDHPLGEFHALTLDTVVCISTESVDVQGEARIEGLGESIEFPLDQLEVVASAVELARSLTCGPTLQELAAKAAEEGLDFFAQLVEPDHT